MQLIRWWLWDWAELKIVKMATAESTPSTSHETTPISTSYASKINVSRRVSEQYAVTRKEEKTPETGTWIPFPINIEKLDHKMEIPHVVMPEELASCPQSAYREPGYQKLLYNPIMSDKDSIHSDSMENHWPDYAAEHPEILPEANPNTSTPNRARPKNKAKFKLLTHGIRKRRPKYYFRCKIEWCTYTFSTVKGWNLHHQLHHNTVIYCDKCKKRFSTPSAHHMHQNLHAPMKFMCETGGKTLHSRVVCESTEEPILLNGYIDVLQDPVLNATNGPRIYTDMWSII